MSTQLDKVLTRLRERGISVIQYGQEYRTRCPAHHGTHPSLAFSAGDDGRILFTCHSKKCSYDEICRALGFEPSELMGKPTLPDFVRHATPSKITGYGGKTIHATLEKALQAAAFGVNPERPQKPDRVYPYRNLDGSENLFVCRWNLNGVKEIRPISRVKEGYIVGKQSGQLYPIYGIDRIDHAMKEAETSTVRIYVCEGEKAAEKARSLGLTTTCSPFGSESASKADWEKLDEIAVKYKKSPEIIILPDNDEPGEEYANELVRIFDKFKSRPAVKIVRLAQQSDVTGIDRFPEKGDICELCDLLDGKTTEEIRSIVDKMAGGTASQPEDTSLVLSLAFCSQETFREITSGKPPVIWSVTENTNSELNKIRLAPGKVIVIGGAPGVGKTAFFMQIVFNALRYNPALKVLICNVEMDPQILLCREFSRRTGIPLSKILDHKISFAEKEMLEQCVKDHVDIGKRCSFLVSPFSAKRILESIEKVDADLIVLDYAQRFNIEENYTPDTKEKLNILLELARNKIAKSKKCVLLASALNRSMSNSKNGCDYSGAGITSFRDTSEFEYSVDDAYILGYGPDKTKRNERVLFCLKKRNDQEVDIHLEFDGSHQTFYVPGENVIPTGEYLELNKFSDNSF